MGTDECRRRSIVKEDNGSHSKKREHNADENLCTGTAHGKNMGKGFLAVRRYELLACICGRLLADKPQLVE